MISKLVSATLGVAVAVLFIGAAPGPLVSAEAVGPAGNNGTIKIAETDVAGEEESNANDPHINGCSLSVKFFGYDEGARSATVTFESQAPTLNTLASPIGAQAFNFTGHGPGDQLDATATYTLAFQGTPQENQGYHVKVTVHADGSQGNDTKSKVFWVEGCNTDTKTPNTSVTGVCVVADQVVRLTFINSSTAISNISVNGAASTVAAGATVNVTTPITGATTSVNVTMDGKSQVVPVNCPTGGSGSVNQQTTGGSGQVSAATVVRGGAGAVAVESLPVTSSGGEQLAAIATLFSTVLAAAGAYVIRMRGAIQL